MSDTTARLKLPTLRAGQAQKEISHNEALALIDLLIAASVTGFAIDSPPAAPLAGEAWIVGAAPTGAWAGRADQLAGWTEGGWRFLAPIEGLAVWVREAAVIARFSLGSWRLGEVTAARLMIGGSRVVGSRQPAIADPSGGGVIDVQARSTIATLLAALRTHA